MNFAADHDHGLTCAQRATFIFLKRVEEGRSSRLCVFLGLSGEKDRTQRPVTESRKSRAGVVLHNRPCPFWDGFCHAKSFGGLS